MDQQPGEVSLQRTIMRGELTSATRSANLRFSEVTATATSSFGL
jgi:hypothetical protein